MASKPHGKSDGDRCRAWMRVLDALGARIFLPEIADYEVRRELLRTKAWAGLSGLDRLRPLLDYDPITTQTMRLAADLWAVIRQSGKPTADPQALDADCILAAQALRLGNPGDVVSIATTNPVHLSRFAGVDARPWETITN